MSEKIDLHLQSYSSRSDGGRPPRQPRFRNFTRVTPTRITNRSVTLYISFLFLSVDVRSLATRQRNRHKPGPIVLAAGDRQGARRSDKTKTNIFFITYYSFCLFLLSMQMTSALPCRCYERGQCSKRHAKRAFHRGDLQADLDSESDHTNPRTAYLPVH